MSSISKFAILGFLYTASAVPHTMWENSAVVPSTRAGTIGGPVRTVYFEQSCYPGMIGPYREYGDSKPFDGTAGSGSRHQYADWDRHAKSSIYHKFGHDLNTCHPNMFKNPASYCKVELPEIPTLNDPEMCSSLKNAVRNQFCFMQDSIKELPLDMRKEMTKRANLKYSDLHEKIGVLDEDDLSKLIPAGGAYHDGWGGVKNGKYPGKPWRRLDQADGRDWMDIEIVPCGDTMTFTKASETALRKFGYKSDSDCPGIREQSALNHAFRSSIIDVLEEEVWKPRGHSKCLYYLQEADKVLRKFKMSDNHIVHILENSVLDN